MVVDTSILVKWFVVEDDSWQAIAFLRACQKRGIRLTIPSLALAELGNVLLKHVMNGVLTLEASIAILSELPRFVDITENSLAYSKRALVLAHGRGLRTAYDMHFVALAEHLKCDLWTADERLWKLVSPEFPFVRLLSQVQSADD